MNYKYVEGKAPLVTSIQQLQPDQTATLEGWVYHIRQMRGFSFLLLRLQRETVQCILTEEQGIPLPKEGDWLTVSGLVRQEPRCQLGLEIVIQSLTVMEGATREEEPPVSLYGKKQPLPLDTLLAYRPYLLRREEDQAVFRLQAGLCQGIRQFLEGEQFVEIHTPKILSAGAEGGANLFRLEYFGKEAFLAQSPQFYKQMLVGVFGRVYEMAPVFRAERHDTVRHLNEYTSIDLEMGPLHSFTQLMELETAMLNHLLEFLKGEYARELSLLSVRLPDIRKGIPKVTFREAKLLAAEELGRPLHPSDDLEPEEEKAICRRVSRESGEELIFVTHYPSSKRPFYAMDASGQTEGGTESETLSFDLLFRGAEITTGGQRIHSYRQQVEKMRRKGLDPEDFSSYLMAHRYGLPPHGGLGLGLERLTMGLLEMGNIRTAALFPRDASRLRP